MLWNSKLHCAGLCASSNCICTLRWHSGHQSLSYAGLCGTPRNYLRCCKTCMGAKASATNGILMLATSPGGTWRTARCTPSATLPRSHPRPQPRQAPRPLHQRSQRSHRATAAARPAARRPGTARRRRVRPGAAAAPARQRLLRRLVGLAATAPAPLVPMMWVMRQAAGALAGVQERHPPRGPALQGRAPVPGETATGAPCAPCDYMCYILLGACAVRCDAKQGSLWRGW